MTRRTTLPFSRAPQKLAGDAVLELLVPGEILQLFINGRNIERLPTKIPVTGYAQQMRGTGIARKNITEQKGEPPQTPVEIESVPEFSKVIADCGTQIQTATVIFLPGKPRGGRGMAGDSKGNLEGHLQVLERAACIHTEVPDNLLIRPLSGTTNQQRACPDDLAPAEADTCCIDIYNGRHLLVAVQAVQRARHGPSLMRFRL